MKRTIKIMRAIWFMDPTGYNCLLPIFIIISGLISIMICFETTSMVNNYVNRGTIIAFSGIVIQFQNVITFSYVFIYNTQGINIFNGKTTNNFNNFLLQAPVLKKYIYTVKFAIIQMVCVPPLIVVIYFIGLNIFVSTSALISAYSGFIVLLYCIWTMTLSLSIGFSSLSSKKYKAIVYSFPILMLLSLVFIIYSISIPYLQPGTLVTDQNIFSALGPIFIPILKACRHIGGFPGLIVITASSIISYFLGCKLPLKISEKVGY